MTQCLGTQCLSGPKGRSQALLSLWFTLPPPAYPFFEQWRPKDSPALSSSACKLNDL